MKKIQTLDSLRFFMILFIVLSHFDWLNSFESTQWFYETFMKHAKIPVDYFFILSGFGMMYSFMSKGTLLSLKPSFLFSYGIRHIKKLYWLYIALLIVCIPHAVLSYYCEIGFLGSKFWVGEILKFIFCIPLLQSATGLTSMSHAFNGVSWFLSCLFCIYLVSPILLVCLGKLNKWSSMLIALIANIGLLFMARTIFLEIDSRTFFNDLTYGSPYCRIFYVSTGMLLARITTYLRQSSLFEKRLVFSITEIFVLLLVIGASVAKVYSWPFGGVFTPYMTYIVSCIIIFVFSFELGFVSKFLQQGGG